MAVSLPFCCGPVRGRMTAVLPDRHPVDNARDAAPEASMRPSGRRGAAALRFVAGAV
jgi:hypothetical protein